MKSPVEKKINGETFRYTPILATESLKLRIKILQILGGAIDRLPAILKGANPRATEEEKEAANAAGVAAFADIFAKADPDRTTALIKEIVEIAEIKRPSGYDQVQMDLDFTENPDALIPVVVFVLKEIFGNFSAGVQGAGLQNLQVMGNR